MIQQYLINQVNVSAITIYPRLFGTRLIGTRPIGTRLIGTLKIDRVHLERVSLARNHQYTGRSKRSQLQITSGPSLVGHLSDLLIIIGDATIEAGSVI